jgi:prophage regulatory protein
MRILRLPSVVDRTGESRTTIYARITANLFPRPIQLGVRSVGWLESEVEAMIAARVRGASDDDVRTLVATLEAARKAVA